LKFIVHYAHKMGRRTHKKGMAARRNRKPLIAAVDLFCGAGGLTRGLEKAGIDVRLGVDIDPACKFPFTVNNRADFLLESVADLSGADLGRSIADAHFTLLAGCAPCQPFSTYQQKLGPSDGRWHLLEHFGRLAGEIAPDLITMENVPNLRKQKIFRDFVCALGDLDFHVNHFIVNCVDYGVPQQRQRLVLLASGLGPIELGPRKPKRR
jgi:DNA (cytosine-5)-methyltransferase 1